MSRSPFRSRREVLASLTASGLFGLPHRRRGGLHCTLAPGTGEHPDPRPGIDGARVLTAGQLADTPDLISGYDGVRAIPHRPGSVG